MNGGESREREQPSPALSGGQKAVLGAVYLLICLALWAGNLQIRPAGSAALFLGAFSLLAFLNLLRAASLERLRPYLRGRRAVFLALICLYASFASFGYRLFLSGDFVSITPGGVMTLLMGALWFFPVLTLLLTALEWIGGRVLARSGGPRPGAGRVWALASLVFLLCLCVGLAAFYPGAFPHDVVIQIADARQGVYNDWHPVLHTLYFRLLLSLWDEPGFFTFVQLLLLSLLAGRAAVIPYRCGARLSAVLAGTAVFALLPNQILVNISPVKDCLFTYALLWVTLLLTDLALDLAVLRKPGYLIQLTLGLFFVRMLRHNGVVPLLFVCAFLLILTIRRWKTVRLRAAACAAAALVLIAVVRGPVFSALGVVPNSVSPYETMFYALGSCVNKQLPLSENTTALLETVMPLEDWAAYYNRFQGHDQYLWGRENGSMDLSRITAREAFACYLEALRRYPGVVLKDRLDGANILWDVTQPAESFNLKYFDYVEINEAAGFTAEKYGAGDYYYNRNPVSQFYRELAHLAMPGEDEADQLHDIFLWRTGAYLLFFLLLALYWGRHGLKRLWWASLPLAGNTAGLALCLYHQSFRYVYYVQILTVVLALATFLLQKQQAVQTKEKEEERKIER